MQHVHVLKKLNFVLLTPKVKGGGSAAKYLLPSCGIGDSFAFGMQQDHVL